MKYLFPIIGWLIAIFLAYLLFKSDTNFSDLEKQNKTLLDSVSNIEKENIKILKINDSLDNIILNHKDKIITIIKVKDEKIKRVDNLNTKQYKQFFTDRYN